MGGVNIVNGAINATLNAARLCGGEMRALQMAKMYANNGAW